MPVEQMMTLRALRNRSGYTQEEVASNIGVSRRTLMRWEKNSNEMPIKYMEVFADLYNYPIDQIFFGDTIAFSDKIRKEL